MLFLLTEYSPGNKIVLILAFFDEVKLIGVSSIVIELFFATLSFFTAKLYMSGLGFFLKQSTYKKNIKYFASGNKHSFIQKKIRLRFRK